MVGGKVSDDAGTLGRAEPMVVAKGIAAAEREVCPVRGVGYGKTGCADA
jgi:hypothetical protein